MTAFFIAHVDVDDRETFRAYEKGVMKSIKPFKGRVLAANPGLRLDAEEP